jgi:hypothetical protein
MGTQLLANESDEAFCAVEEPAVAREVYVSRRVASDEEAATAFLYAISKHKKALEELARYDRS